MAPFYYYRRKKHENYTGRQKRHTGIIQAAASAFESEAEMIGSRDVPALQEAEEENARDFSSQINIRLYEKMGYKSIKNIQKKVDFLL